MGRQQGQAPPQWMPSQHLVPAQNVALVPQQRPPHSMAPPAQTVGGQPSLTATPLSLMKKSGHRNAERQTVLTSLLHSFSAAPELHPRWTQRVPCGPGALQNCTREQLAALRATSPVGPAADAASTFVELRTTEESSSVALLGSCPGASAMGCPATGSIEQDRMARSGITTRLLIGRTFRMKIPPAASVRVSQQWRLLHS